MLLLDKHCANIGLIMDIYWANIRQILGKILCKYWANIVQIKGNYHVNIGRILVKYLSNIAKLRPAPAPAG